MDVKEKLVDLLMGHSIDTQQDVEYVADHLIANGVTVQENVEISDELLKQLKNAPITICKEEPSIELAQEWISVDEKLPQNFISVLGYMTDGLWRCGLNGRTQLSHTGCRYLRCRKENDYGYQNRRLS